MLDCIALDHASDISVNQSVEFGLFHAYHHAMVVPPCHARAEPPNWAKVTFYGGVFCPPAADSRNVPEESRAIVTVA